MFGVCVSVFGVCVCLVYVCVKFPVHQRSFNADKVSVAIITNVTPRFEGRCRKWSDHCNEHITEMCYIFVIPWRHHHVRES